MSSSYRYSSTSQHSYTHQQLPDLQPVFSALALVVLIALFSHLGLSLLAPRESFRALSEMTSLGVSNLLGKAGLGKVNWAKSDESEGGLGGLVGEGKGKVVRRYKDTKDGASRAAGGGTLLFLSSRTMELIFLSRTGQHYPGLLNAAGNLCFLNATLQVRRALSPPLTSADFPLPLLPVDGFPSLSPLLPRHPRHLRPRVQRPHSRLRNPPRHPRSAQHPFDLSARASSPSRTCKRARRFLPFSTALAR